MGCWGPSAASHPPSPGIPPWAWGLPSPPPELPVLSRDSKPAWGQPAGDSHTCLPAPPAPGAEPSAPAGGWSGVPGAVSLAEEYEEQYAESRVTGQTFRAAGHLPPDTPPEPSPRPPPAKRLEFVLMVSAGAAGQGGAAPASPAGEGLARLGRQLGQGGHLCPSLVPLVGHVPFPPQPPSRPAGEEESTGTTALGARPPDTSLSLPTSPDKEPAWTRAFPLPTLEEKQWHQSCSVQTNIVPINVSGRAAPPRAEARGAAPAAGRDAGCRRGCAPAPGCGGGTGWWEGAGAASLRPRGPGGRRGQQGHIGVCHSQPICPAIRNFVCPIRRPRHRPLSCPHCAAQPAGLLSPWLSPHSMRPACLACLCVRPSVLTGLQVPPARSCPVLAGTRATLCPQVRA